MATYSIIKFKEMSPLHIGIGRENYDFSANRLHSDTILAALSSIKAMHGDADHLEEFLQNVKVSTAFPYIGDRYFLPKPYGTMNVTISDCEEHIANKKLKKICYIELPIWNELIQGNAVVISLAQIHGEFLCNDTNLIEAPFISQVNQRVFVPREDNADTQPFFFDWTYFSKDAGLYCIVDCPETLNTQIFELFQQLGEEGIGTDRSVGGGKFAIEQSSISLTEVQSADALMLLSLFIPTEEDMAMLDTDNSRFELILRNGFISASIESDFRHLRKKSIYMLNVGSVLATSAPILNGKIVDLKPEYNDNRMHPVYRSGKPLYIPIKL